MEVYFCFYFLSSVRVGWGLLICVCVCACVCVSVHPSITLIIEAATLQGGGRGGEPECRETCHLQLGRLKLVSGENETLRKMCSDKDVYIYMLPVSSLSWGKSELGF